MLAPFENPKQDLGGNIVGQITGELDFLPGKNLRQRNLQNIALDQM